MGCAPSGTSCKGGGLRLMATKITFTKDQLDNLNAYFLKNLEEERCEVLAEITEIEGIVERLVQRLIVAVGNLDSRFSSMFLVSLNERRRIKQLRFEYLVRLDALSTPTVLQDNESAVNIEEDTSMPGFARLKVLGLGAESWSEFLGPAGRIRRDLIKNRLTNLLAAATKPETIKEIDERTCFTPGQVVDPEILDNILKQPDHCRIFFGPATSEATLPEPRDHRIAIVEDASGILLKIGLGGTFSKKVNEVEVRLLIGAATASWSSLADYPRRVPLHHCDALLHFTAAQSGMYVVAVGPHPGARCEDRATLWKIRLPAVETIVSRHYSEDSVPSLTESVLMEILNQLRGRRLLDLPIKNKDFLRIVSRHILKTIHWWSLERAGPDPLRSWAPDTLSRHVLLALDELVTALKCQSLRCYFYPRCNVMLQCAKGGTLHHEDSYISDSRVLESYLSILHQHSLNMSPSVPKPIDILENELITRWKRVMSSLPRGTMGTHYGYTVRQLEYLGLVVKEVLGWKEHSAEGFENGTFPSFPISSHSPEPVENLLYLVTLILRQAREQIYAITDCRNRKRERRKLKSYGRRRSNAATYFDRSVDVLLDMIRRDRETAYLDLESNSIMARTLLKWLYFAMENDKKTLGPILRPYLGNLFNSSHENAWHVESWKKRREILATEMRSLALFCKLVTAQEVSPADGIVEALSKGWLWAENITRMIERSDRGLKLVFITSTRVIKYNLTFTNNKGLSTFSTWSKARNIGNALKRTTVARTNILTTCILQEPSYVTEGVAGHVELRDASPLTHVVSLGRRKGRQRGPGGLIPGLVALNKFRILQEVAAVLPQEERTVMLDAVQRVAREASRRLRRTSCPDSSSTGSPRQTYRARSESSLLDSPDRISPSTRQRRIIAEHQRQLRREIEEMQDTLTRGFRSRDQLPSWDVSSLASWSSSLGSIGRNNIRRNRMPAWEYVRGPSPMWDTVSSDGSFTKCKSEEMISREDSPKWNVVDNRREKDDTDFRLPTWDHLEATLNKKLSRFENFEPDSLEMNRDVGIDYLMTTNARKEMSQEMRAVEKLSAPVLKQDQDMSLRLSLRKD